MKTNITLIKTFSLFIALFCGVNFGFGQSIFDNPIFGTNPSSSNPYTIGQNVVSNITVSGIGRGPGIGAPAATNDRYNANNWNSPSLNLDDYFEFILTPNSGYEIDFVSFVYSSQRSNGTFNNFAIRSSIDGFTSTIATPAYIAPPAQTTINLGSAAYRNITSAITFRFYAWGASAGTGTFSINDFTFNGVVSPLGSCASVTTWDGTNWSPSSPDLTTVAIIDNDYDTSIGGSQISFSACSLIVSNNATLSIADDDYVEVENELTLEALGFINVQPYGAFVQNNDASINSVSGNIKVDKETAAMNAWYEYTYWSSPVSGAQFQVAIPDSEPSRRFIFNGQNFLDHCAETGNNNICDNNGGLGLQDDIDDNNNDWQWVPGTTVMAPGKGYATTLTEFAYNIAPGTSNKKFRFTFEGDFNNGIVQVPLYRNDFELNDNNWNLIGNPYPSAIDADLFLAANSDISTDVDTPKSINGAIFLWSQNTNPSASANGNQVLNFSSDDYAIINAVGENAGGDGTVPSIILPSGHRAIPSGQAFFVSMSNLAPATVVSGTIMKSNSDVIFNNSMRVKGATDNNMFFKNTNTKGKANPSAANKLWVNLTSDNGVFNQILVGYVNGATNDDDGVAFDAAKYPSKGSALYTTIEGSNKKFAIQGKDENSLNEDEIINLGFKTTITIPTLYKLSVAQLEGAFLTSNTIFLVDTLLNKVHDLSASDYTFTSAAGEFNSRFSIAFTNKALSVNDVLLNTNALKIVELQDDFVQFNTSSNLTIKSVNIYDLLGRQLYQFKGENTSETYRLSHLNNSVYIAKVALSNGAVVTKKAVKK
jgi:hypothetical protein